MAQSDAQRSPLAVRRTMRQAPEPKPFAVQLPRLWKAMILTSFVLNLVLFTVVGVLLAFGFTWRNDLLSTTTKLQSFARGNVSELRDVVQQLQSAHIITNIALSQNLPLKGAGVSVPVDQETVVTLQEPVPLSLAGADIDLGAGNRLHATNINLVLPQGTPLKIKLQMNIPLDDVTIPIKLQVPVDIAMADTQLAPQFKRLGDVVDRLASPAGPLLGIEIPMPKPVPTAKPKP